MATGNKDFFKRQPGIGSHHSAAMYTDEWLTPPSIISALGEFDLDPCFSGSRPWDTAREHYTEFGLQREWYGRVWLNPPYGLEAALWLKKLADHGNGIALIFARTETDMFFEQVWKRAHGLLFIRGRLNFHFPDGRRAEKNSGGPSVLIAYGITNVKALKASGIDGKLIVLA